MRSKGGKFRDDSPQQTSFFFPEAQRGGGGRVGFPVGVELRTANKRAAHGVLESAVLIQVVRLGVFGLAHLAVRSANPQQAAIPSQSLDIGFLSHGPMLE